MPWAIQTLPDSPVIEARFEGELSREEVAKAVYEVVSLAASRRPVLVLGDCTRLRGGHTVADLFALIRSLADSSYADAFVEAVLPPLDGPAAREVDFWIFECQRRGMRVRRFVARDEALAWLAGEDAAQMER